MVKDFLHFLSIEQMSKEDLLRFFTDVKKTKKENLGSGMEKKLLASCFFEPSTRTRLSFEAAMLTLGGQILRCDEQTTSIQKGESLQDTIRTIGSYADVIVLRHPCEGASILASEATSTPVVNAGDGAGEHPTQTLIDLFTLQETCGDLHDLHVGIVGDLFYGRTSHSLALALSHFKPRLYFVSPRGLQMPSSLCYKLKRRGIKFSFHETLKDSASKWDVLYMTRLQKERNTTSDACPYFCLKKSDLSYMKPTIQIFHPLPRTEEMDPALDDCDQAYYFQQMQNGLPVRKTLLSWLLEKRQ